MYADDTSPGNVRREQATALLFYIKCGWNIKQTASAGLLLLDFACISYFSPWIASLSTGVYSSAEKMDTELGEVARQTVPSISVFYCQHSI